MQRLAKLSLFLSLTSWFIYISSSMADDSKSVLALVNGTEITAEQIEQLPGDNEGIDFASLEDGKKMQIIIALINRQLVIQQAKKDGFDQTERIAAAVKDMTETYIVKQYLMKVAAGTDISEEAVSAFYEEKYLNQPEQFEVAHILLATREEADGVLELLNQGADFASLAKLKSKDRVSAEKGGDLGWLTPGDMLASFYETVSELNPGSVSAQPTKTQFGWHVIKLIEKRESARQALAQVEQSIRKALIEENIATYLENLRAGATIEFR